MPCFDRVPNTLKKPVESFMARAIELGPIQPGASDRSHEDTIGQKGLPPNSGVGPTMRSRTHTQEIELWSECECVLEDVCV